MEYFVDVYFSQLSVSDKKAKSFILIDSVSSSVTSPLRLYLYTVIFFFTDYLEVFKNNL